MNTRLLLLQARSPLHCGTGQAVSGIDLPIAREKATGIPLVPGSSLKGVLRARGSDTDDAHRAVFGPPTENASEHAGSLQFGDAVLAFLPVRSVRGTFAWVTSRYLLRRLASDVAEAGLPTLRLPTEPAAPPDATPPGDNAITAKIATGSRLPVNDRVVFEDLDFRAKEDPELTALAKTVAGWLYDSEDDRAFFTARVCLVHDDVMSVLMESAVEITARNSLSPDTKTVKKGALWTEESLPTETVLSGLLSATPVAPKGTVPPTADALFKHLAGLLQGGTIQLGGNATIGRGLCSVRLVAK